MRAKVSIKWESPIHKLILKLHYLTSVNGEYKQYPQYDLLVYYFPKKPMQPR